ncbi:hypothetical protein ACFHYQ_18505 [Sphaerimonospora cavernae]|uniref:Oxidoreductase n=1 Tax=Sphaerimonospora cavernae TaxID=1740611 RepID=A0ABV6U790_9ACTN
MTTEQIRRSGPLRWTGTGKLVSFYRYFAFNAPKTTTAGGMALLAATAVAQMFLLIRHSAAPAYVVVWFLLMIIGSLLAAFAMSVGSVPALTRSGWALGSAVSLASIAMYFVSRAVGLPGLPQMLGHWHYPLGNVTLAIGLFFLGLHFSVVTGMNVAYPKTRGWHD